MLKSLKELDIALSTSINHCNGPLADFIFTLASERLTWVPLYLILAVYLHRQFGLKSFILMLLSIGLAIVASDQISVAMKFGFERLRPCHEPNLNGFIHLPAGCGGQFGFVSSHAANTAALAMLASLFSKKKWLIMLFAFYALANSYSRVYLGKHYVGDVIGGMILGVTIGVILYTTFRKIEHLFFNKKS